MEEKKSKKMDWAQFIGRMVNITMLENYGVVYNEKNQDEPMFFEIVFKSGVLTDCFDDALLLSADRNGAEVKVYVPFSSIKCVEIF
ncbi:MAG: hypothetical protein Fur0015_13490 [Ignavibacteriales bacterium]